MVIMADAAVGRAQKVRLDWVQSVHFAPSQEGGLVALWMTNRERHWRFVERELLPGWGLQPVASWLWLKAADDGRPVAPLVSESLRVWGLHVQQLQLTCTGVRLTLLASGWFWLAACALWRAAHLV